MTMFYEYPIIVQNIMCASNCGPTVHGYFEEGLAECKRLGLLTEGAILNISPSMDSKTFSPSMRRMGLNCLILTVEDSTVLSEERQDEIFNILKKTLLASNYYKIVEDIEDLTEEPPSKNGLNVLLNSLAGLGIILLSLIFPPSLPLTLIMVALSFATTAYTAREHLSPFFKNFSWQNLTTMNSAVALGWILSLTHSLYHAAIMPLSVGFSMIFMNFLMPLILITLVNVLDEIKRSVTRNSRNMHMRNLGLFPKMAENYITYILDNSEELTAEEQEALLIRATTTEGEQDSEHDNQSPLLALAVNKLIAKIGSKTGAERSIKILRAGMIIEVPSGACFPANCVVLPQNGNYQGSVLVDEALMTGESQAQKPPLKEISSGALNLGPKVYAYVLKSPYYSAANEIFFRANREVESQKSGEIKSDFSVIYASIIVISLIAAIFAPLAFGVWTVPLVLQNITGILFGLCPCTLLLAHELPFLMSLYHRGQQGVTLREESLLNQQEPIHTVIFDKTGTLTTGLSSVESWGGLSPEVQQRVFLLEKEGDPEHVVAKAICNAYGACGPYYIPDVQQIVKDENHRGITGLVQNQRLHLGNQAYLKSFGISVPEASADKIKQGFSPVYVAQNNIFQGIIYIAHEIRAHVAEDLQRLKKDGVRIILITGDTEASALALDERCGSPFGKDNIYFAQTPQNKENIVEELAQHNPRGIWSIGDGLNDVMASTMLREKGAVTGSITPDASASSFSDICLDGSLSYLFIHQQLNQFWQKNKLQNQALLIYGALVFLACILSCSFIGIAAAPIVSLLIMCSTTLSVLFNSYRVKLTTDIAFGHNDSWAQNLFASDLSIGLLTGANILFMSALFISTIATGGWSLPFFVFTAGASTTISSLCLTASLLSLSAFVSLGIASWIDEDEPIKEFAAAEELPLGQDSAQQRPGVEEYLGLQFSPGVQGRGKSAEAENEGCFPISCGW